MEPTRIKPCATSDALVNDDNVLGASCTNYDAIAEGMNSIHQFVVKITTKSNLQVVSRDPLILHNQQGRVNRIHQKRGKQVKVHWR